MKQLQLQFPAAPIASAPGGERDASERRIRELTAQVEQLKQEVARLRTRHLRAEERDQGLGSLLTEREVLFAEVERLAHVGSWLWDVRSNEVAWSDECYRILGYDPARDEPTIENFYTALHPDDRDLIRRMSEHAATTGAPDPAARCRVVHRDGTVRNVILTGAPIHDQAERLIRIVGAILDVTDFVAVEDELRRTAQLLNDAERIANIGSWSWTPATDRIDWSDTMYRLFAVPAGTPVTRELFLSRVHPEDRERVAATAVTKASLEYRVLRPDGTVRHVAMEANTERDADGKIVRMVGTAQDVTARRQLEEQLRHSQKMEAVGTLAGGVAHDFNNYLVVIHGNIDLLKSALPPDAPEQDMLNEIATAAGRCGTLTRQLLAFSRKHVTAPRLVDPGHIVAESGKMLRRLVGEHIELSLNVAPRMAAVRADPAHIEQIIVNLAVNARDAMPDGGTLTIGATNCMLDAEFVHPRPPLAPGPHVRLTVTDTGTGIPAAIRTRIFEPFFTTKEPGRGTGLGLATVYGIVQQCRGYIEFESHEGSGSEFSVYLPAEQAVPEDDTVAAPAPARANGETLLVAEDEVQVRKLCQRVLGHAGYRVLLAEDGLTALRLAERVQRIDLLLTDVRMPRLGGIELARRLRAGQPEMKVLFMSGYVDIDGDATHDVGVSSSLMTKPFTTRQLLSAVRTALDEARP